MTAQPTLTVTDTAFHVEAYEKIEYSLRYADGAFAIGSPEIAYCYRPFGRCLMVVDETVYGLYGEQIDGQVAEQIGGGDDRPAAHQIIGTGGDRLGRRRDTFLLAGIAA